MHLLHSGQRLRLNTRILRAIFSVAVVSTEVFPLKIPKFFEVFFNCLPVCSSTPAVLLCDAPVEMFHGTTGLTHTIPIEKDVLRYSQRCFCSTL